jgi:hypothetical protein
MRLSGRRTHGGDCPIDGGCPASGQSRHGAAATRYDADPGLHAWFESLRQPNWGLACCSISDCNFVSYTVVDGHYEIIVEGDHYAVPAATIVFNIENPTGRAIPCYTLVPVLRGAQPKTSPTFSASCGL